MTIRLVGLMSLVLLLSLAAFAYLMSSYQVGVMQEVNRTVSAVGKATLQTFEFHADDSPNGEKARPAEAGSRKHEEFAYEVRKITSSDDTPLPAGVGVSTAGTASGGGDAEIRVKVDEPTGQVGRPDIGTLPSAPGVPPGGEAKRSGGFIKRVIRLHGSGGETPSGEAPSTPVRDVVLVQIEDVRAESDAAHGTVLKIPTYTVKDEGASKGDASGGKPTWIRTDEPPATGASGTGAVARHEIVLPISTHDFQDLFADYRRRTLLLFLGIFILGTLLSAGLAAHFTRPVRRLDAGIRRLTEGDLEVQVEARGRDEMGRLARGFNEMTRRLRAGRERERDLRRREKLSALGRLAAGVAHDVRNPLHSIGLTIQNLEETARPGEEERGREFDRSVGIIREEIRRLDRLVENFLRFARSDRSARVAVDLARLARETAQLVEKEAERRRVEVRVDVDGEPAVVEGDMESIRSSVLNLVLNSFEAMPDGGTLALTVGSVGGEARLEVSDTGRGIPRQDQEKVFEFAYTTREDGHGLGLAMVHQVVVEDHGGRVSLESRPGEGTRVLLAFPPIRATHSSDIAALPEAASPGTRPVS